MKSDPLPAHHDALRLSLNETDLDPGVISRLVSQARNSVLLVTRESEEDAIPLGASKLGGRPDLPPGTAWPTRPPYPDGQRRADEHHKNAARLLADSKKPRSWMTPEQGERSSRDLIAKAAAVTSEFPLAFIGQFDLSELSQEHGFDRIFPTEGRLLLFYDYWEYPEDFTPEASVGWRLLWDTTPVSDLVRAAVPAALSSISNDEWTCVFKAASISTRTVLTPISPDDESWDAFPLDDDEALEEYQQWLSGFGTPDMDERDNHQFGGFPQTLQNGLQATSQLVSNGLYCGNGDAWKTDEAKELLKSAKDWRLVLQIGVDPHAGIPGPGAYYIIMREQDIIARRFEKARVTYQCD